MTATLPKSGEGRPQAGYMRTNRDRSPQRQQIRAAVVEAALRLFLDRGHLAVRVEDIVDEVGISRATFYKYFAERDEILAELFAQLLTTDVEPPQGGSSLERIQNLLVAATQQMTKWEDLARFIYSIPLRHDAVLPGGSGEPAVMTTVQRLVQEGVAAGELRSDVPADVLSRHVAGSFEAAMREWATRQVDDAPERVRLLLDVAIGGLRDPAAAPRPRHRSRGRRIVVQARSPRSWHHIGGPDGGQGSRKRA